MPTVPMGGLSFFLNVSIIIIGAVIKYLKKRGFPLHSLHALFARVIGKQFDNAFRRVIGYGIMFSIFFFLFMMTSISFIHRLQTETNVDFINNALHLN